MLSGYAVFFLLHPNFYRSFLNERKEIGVYSYEDLMARIGNVLNTFQQFIIMPVSPKYILLFALALGLLIVYRHKRLLPIERIRLVDRRGIRMLYFFLWTAGVQIALYLGYLSPQHAVLPKYFSMAWPFLAFLPVFILRFSTKFRNHLTIGFCLLLLLSAAKGLLFFNDYLARQPDPSAVLKNSRAVVLDNASLNVLPRLMAKLPDDKLVFAAYRDHLLNHQEAWSNRLDSGAVFISVAAPLLSTENSENRKKIYDIINQTYETELNQGGVWGFGDLILIGRKRRAPSP
jgi:hypothetical protein